MPKTVNTPLPVNYPKIPPELQKYFNTHYIYRDQKVLFLKNCHVSYNGIVIRNLRYIKESCYDYKTYRKLYFYPAFKTVLFSYITRWGKKNKMRLPDDGVYSVIYQPYINYFHWIFESLTRLLILEKVKKDTTLIIVQEDMEELRYIKDSLSLLGISNYKLVPYGRLLFVKRLALPSLVRWGGQHDPEVILELRDKVLKHYNDLNLHVESPERLFVKRTGRRKIVNFDEASSLMQKYGFSVVDFENMSLQEQIGIMKNVKILVAQHGAALVNMMFMPLGSTVVEIHSNPLKIKNKHLDDVYFNISSIFRHKYYAFFSEPVGSVENIFTADCRIDLTGLEEILQQTAITSDQQ